MGALGAMFMACDRGGNAKWGVLRDIGMVATGKQWRNPSRLSQRGLPLSKQWASDLKMKRRTGYVVSPNRA
jgi:hypothetical protein